MRGIVGGGGGRLWPLQTESGRAAGARAAKLEQWVYTAGIQTERASRPLTVCRTLYAIFNSQYVIFDQ